MSTCGFGCVCHLRLFVVVLRSKFCPFYDVRVCRRRGFCTCGRNGWGVTYDAYGFGCARECACTCVQACGFVFVLSSKFCPFVSIFVSAEEEGR